MHEKANYILTTAEELMEHHQTMTVTELAERLNSAGYSTNDGAPYSGGRGTYRLVAAAYWRVMEVLGDQTAGLIAMAFVKPDGSYAWGEPGQ